MDIINGLPLHPLLVHLVVVLVPLTALMAIAGGVAGGASSARHPHPAGRAGHPHRGPADHLRRRIAIVVGALLVVVAVVSVIMVYRIGESGARAVWI